MLIVTLHSPSQTATSQGFAHEMAYAQTSASLALIKHGTASLALLPKSEQTVLMLPATALSWHKVDLPKLPRSTAQTKLRAVLDGLMEEKLLDDTEKLHLALWQQNRADGSTQPWVAACDKAWLAAAIQDFQTAGHHVVSIVPHSMPWSAASQLQGSDAGNDVRNIHISGNIQDAMLSVCDADGVLHVPAQAASALLAPLPDHAPEFVSAEPAVAAMAEALVGKLLPDARVHIRSSAQQAVHAL